MAGDILQNIVYHTYTTLASGKIRTKNRIIHYTRYSRGLQELPRKFLPVFASVPRVIGICHGKMAVQM